MMAVPLYGKYARGRVTWVSESRYDLVIAHRWWVQEQRRPGGGVKGPYARTSIWSDGRKASVFMHNLIMGCTGVDHRNGYGLDNTDPNLRVATEVENGRNRQPNAGASSGFKGVSWHRQHQKWSARIMVSGKSRWLGLFADEVAAARAYDDAAVELHGAFTRLNFPDRRAA
jgi:hypothetical protein